MVTNLLPHIRQFVRVRQALTTLELTPVEARVAVWLTEGKSVRDIAEATGQSQGAIYWHLKQIYRKQSLSRQANLVRLVLSLAELG